MNKNIILVLGVLIFTLISISTVTASAPLGDGENIAFSMNFTHALNGTSTFTKQGNSGNVLLSATPNVTITNMTFYYRLDTATAWTKIGVNTSAISLPTKPAMTIVWATASLVDGNYTLNATGANYLNNSNATYWELSSVIYNITIDNTKPAITYGSSCPANGDTDYDSTTTLDTTTDTSLKVCDFYYKLGAASVYTREAIAVSSNKCSKTLTNSQAGEVSYYWVVSDGYNNTNFVVSPRMYKYSAGGAPIMSSTSGGVSPISPITTSSGGSPLVTTGTETGTTGTQLPWTAIIILLVVIVFIWQLTKRKR